MRHGPTDGEVQQVTTDIGKRQMHRLDAWLIANGLTPGQIVVSEWCRNQQTLDAMSAGMLNADQAALDGAEIAAMGDLNLLLSSQGVSNVMAMPDFVGAWDGGDRNRPLLSISRFSTVQTVSDRSAFEGRRLLLEPVQENKVMGELKPQSARPDVEYSQ